MKWFRYVRHHDVGRFICSGWFPVSDLGPTHGVYSILMQWGGLVEPPDIKAS
jgi:hypothetical protein